MCERSGRDADMCPYQMHCVKRCLSCGDDGDAVCMNPLPPTVGGERAGEAEPPPQAGT